MTLNLGFSVLYVLLFSTLCATETFVHTLYAFWIDVMELGVE